jgi:type VI secretion system (T6SS) immunity protein Tdi1
MEMYRPAGTEVLAGLDAWSWAAPGTALQPKFVSPFADVFFAAEDGAIWHLSPILGELRRAWPDRAALTAELATPEGQDEYLNSVWAQAAERRGLVLGEADAFHFAPPPALGGQFDVDNILVASITVVLSLAGQLHGPR